MDTGTNIIGLSFLLFCLVIFVIISGSHRKKEKLLLQMLEGLAAQNNCRITQHDTWHQAAIGIDYDANMLFAVRSTASPVYFQAAIAEIQKCSIIKTMSMGGDAEDNFKTIDQLSLSFTYWDKGQPADHFDFFNTGNGSRTLDGELQLVEKWHNLVNSRCTFLQLKH